MDCYLRTDIDPARCSKDPRFNLYQRTGKTFTDPKAGLNCCCGKGGEAVPGAPEPFGTGISLARCEQACETYGNCTGIIVRGPYTPQNLTDQCNGIATQCSAEICGLKPGQVSRLKPGTCLLRGALPCGTEFTPGMGLISRGHSHWSRYYHNKQIFMPSGSAIIGAGINRTLYVHTQSDRPCVLKTVGKG